MRGFDDAIRVLVEHFEKIAFTRQQLAKQHSWLLNGEYDGGMSFL